MPPKKQKVPNTEEKEGPQQQNQHEEQNGDKKSSKTGDIFKCICGKTYGSLAAVHTHINNKHSTNEAEKKKYKAQIFNPKKSGQTATTSIRMKDINYPEVQAQLMCHADINLKVIYDIYCQIQPNFKEKDILIDVNDDLSDDSDIDIDDDLVQKKPAQETMRRKNIREKVKRIKEQYKIEEINQLVRGDADLTDFKISKFRLNIITELSKFFIVDFAAKVQVSLQMIHALQKLRTTDNQSLKEAIGNVLEVLWEVFPKIKDQLFIYYNEWNQIRYHYLQWKAMQTRL